MNSYKINNRPYYKRENVIRFSIDIIIRVTVTTRREIAYIQKQTMIKTNTARKEGGGRMMMNGRTGVCCICVCVWI